MARIGERWPRWVFVIISGATIPLITNIKTAEQYKKMLGKMLCDADARIIDSDPNFMHALMRSIQEAYRQGAGGPSDDAIAIYKDWGLSVSEIAFPILLAHGTEDKHVPFSFSEYMHANLPNSTLIPLEGDGHYTHLVNTSRSFDIIEGIYP
ncbi:MAG: alpha/beta hydrolase [Anaerolineales bacterium]